MKVLCFIGIHNWEIGAHVDETTQIKRRSGRKGKSTKTFEHKHHRECQWCNKWQELVRPKEYHPTKYIWKTIKPSS